MFKTEKQKENLWPWSTTQRSPELTKQEAVTGVLLSKRGRWISYYTSPSPHVQTHLEMCTESRTIMGDSSPYRNAWWSGQRSQNHLQRRERPGSQTQRSQGKGEVFPEITKAAPGPSPMPQDHVAKLKELYHQRPVPLLWKSPPQAPDGEGVSSVWGHWQSQHDRGVGGLEWRTAVRVRVWPTWWSGMGEIDRNVKRGSHGSGWTWAGGRDGCRELWDHAWIYPIPLCFCKWGCDNSTYFTGCND